MAWQDIDWGGRPHFPNYFLWVSRAFDAMLAEQGADWQRLVEKWDLGIPIVHAECDYTVPLSIHDLVIVELRFEKVTPKGFQTIFRIVRKADEREVARGLIDRRFVNRRHFRATEAPVEVCDFFR